MSESINDLFSVHPGEYLKDELEELNISQNRLALEIRVPAARISEIIKGKRGITADTACRLARYFGTSVDLWLNLQATYDKRVVMQKLKAEGELEKIHPRISPVPARA